MSDILRDPLTLVIILIISNLLLFMGFTLMIKPLCDLFKANENLFALYEEMAKSIRGMIENESGMIDCQSEINDNITELLNLIEKERSKDNKHE